MESQSQKAELGRLYIIDSLNYFQFIYRHLTIFILEIDNIL